MRASAAMVATAAVATSRLQDHVYRCCSLAGAASFLLRNTMPLTGLLWDLVSSVRLDKKTRRWNIIVSSVRHYIHSPLHRFTTSSVPPNQKKNCSMPKHRADFIENQLDSSYYERLINSDRATSNCYALCLNGYCRILRLPTITIMDKIVNLLTNQLRWNDDAPSVVTLVSHGITWP